MEHREEVISPLMEAIKAKYLLPQIWADYLSDFSWDWFITIVPDGFPHPESIIKLWDTFIHHLNREIYGQHYWKDKRKGVIWCRATELQKRGAPHHHGLIGGVPDFISRYQFYCWLREHGAQFSKIEIYVPEKGAEFYMSKSTYAWKNGEIDCSATMLHEKDGTRICGKVEHEEWLRHYGIVTRSGLRNFDFS